MTKSRDGDGFTISNSRIEGLDVETVARLRSLSNLSH
jgi:hypothetical protein